MSFAPHELADLKRVSKDITQKTFGAFMRVEGRGSLNVTAMFITMVNQLALARVLEEQLLKVLAKCPDAGLSEQIEALAAEIAGELIRESDAAAAKAQASR